MPRVPRTYQLTPALVAASVGAGVMCLADVGLGRSYRLYAQRPGPAFNRRIELPSSASRVEPAKSPLVRVDVMGPIEQRAGYHDPCSGWSDGHDAIADRLCAAFEEGDVFFSLDTPGGAGAGVQQGTARALAAKAKYGRRCTGWANELIASGGIWWALALCDELFIPVAGQLGSIGARAGHLDLSVALEQAGEKVTYFTWPNAGKVALAAELPLSDVGRARGERDVAIIGEAFCAAVIGSSIGQRYGLDRDRVVALSADVLTGEAAIKAGLGDAVTSEDEVIAYALAMAERGDGAAKSSGARRAGSAQARARGGAMKIGANTAAAPGARAEGDEEAMPPSSKPPEQEPESVRGRDIPTACKSCNVENPVSAKFCMGCGASLATEPKEEAAAASMPAPGAAAHASVAEALGLPAGASVVAQRTRAIELRQVFKHAAKLTAQTEPDAISGGLSALAGDAAKGARYRRERNELREQQTVADRADLCKRLVACGGARRGDVYHDEVNEDGTRKLDANGQPIVTLLEPYKSEISIKTLRGKVETHEKNAPPGNPFEPSQEAAEAAAKNAGKEDVAARVERAKKHPKVIAMLNRPGNTLSLGALAASFVDNNFDLPGAQ